MPSASDTAYPRLKNNPSVKELQDLYTPNDAELLFAQGRTRRPEHQLGLLLLLKTFQRLGYFVATPAQARDLRHYSRRFGRCGVRTHRVIASELKKLEKLRSEICPIH